MVPRRYATFSSWSPRPCTAAGRGGRGRGEEGEGKRERGRGRGEEGEGKRERGRGRGEEGEGEEGEEEEGEGKREMHIDPPLQTRWRCDYLSGDVLPRPLAVCCPTVDGSIFA